MCYTHCNFQLDVKVLTDRGGASEDKHADPVGLDLATRNLKMKLRSKPKTTLDVAIFEHTILIQQRRHITEVN